MSGIQSVSSFRLQSLTRGESGVSHDDSDFDALPDESLDDNDHGELLLGEDGAVLSRHFKRGKCGTLPPTAAPDALWTLHRVAVGTALMCSTVQLAGVASVLLQWLPSWLVALPFLILFMIVLCAFAVGLFPPPSPASALSFTVLACIERVGTSLLVAAASDFIAEMVQEPDGSVNYYMHGVWGMVQFGNAMGLSANVLASVAAISGLDASYMAHKWIRAKLCKPKRPADDGMGGGVLGGAPRGVQRRIKLRRGPSAGLCGSCHVCCTCRSCGFAGPRHASLRHRMCSTKAARCASAGIFCCWGVALFLIFGIGLGFSALHAATRSEPASPPPRSDCDPLVPSVCAMPFPSDFWTQRDADTPTGKRVNLGATTLPATRWGDVDPSKWNEQDGWSTISPLVFKLNEDIEEADLVPHWNIGASLSFNSTTLLIDAETGDLVPHFTERDAYDPDYGLPVVPTLVMQPAVPLKHKTRYIVAVRGLTAAGDSSHVVAPSDAMAALADGSDDSSRGRRFRHDILPVVLRAARCEADALQLAWDFTTVSRDNSLGRVRYMRDDALKTVGHDGPDYEIDDVVTPSGACEDDNHVARWVWGHFESPNYMEVAGPSLSFLTKDPSKDARIGGRSAPTQNGLVRVNFVVLVPCSLTREGAPQADALVQVGHGLFGDRYELHQSWFGEIADKYKWVMMATDWEGMSFVDVPVALRALMLDVGSFAALPERAMQGFVNKAVMLRLAQGKLKSDESMQTWQGSNIIGAQTKAVYYGNSQGSILGGGYIGLSTDIERAALGETGCNYALLLTRSVDFVPYHTVMQLQLWSETEVRFFLSLIQQLWDPAEAAGWLRVVNAEPFDDSPKKAVLLQASEGDAQVTTIAAHIQARAYGAHLLQPKLRPVWNVTERHPPLPAGSSALVEWRYGGVPLPPTTDTAPLKRTDTHECVPRTPEAQDQLHHFFMTGEVKQVCQDLEGGQCIKERCPWSGWGKSDDDGGTVV